MSAKERVAAILLAAGVGSRMGGEVTKQRMNILGRSVLAHTLLAFEGCPDVDDIVVVARREELNFARAECAAMTKVRAVVVGGECRAESARLGFAAVPEGTAAVAIHDAARALITPENISEVVKVALRTGAASAVSVVTDTVKQVDADGIIVATLDRSQLRRAETPQVFKTELYAKAIAEVGADPTVTDDNMLMERIGVKVSAVDVGRENIKITTPEDLGYAEFLLGRRRGANV